MAREKRLTRQLLAEELGMSVPTLRRMMRRWGIGGPRRMLTVEEVNAVRNVDQQGRRAPVRAMDE